MRRLSYLALPPLQLFVGRPDATVGETAELEAHALAGARVVEGERDGAEHQAAVVALCADLVVAVNRIADDGPAALAEVHADLVLAAGEQREPDHAATFASRLKQFVVGDRALALRVLVG